MFSQRVLIIGGGPSFKNNRERVINREFLASFDHIVAIHGSFGLDQLEVRHFVWNHDQGPLEIKFLQQNNNRVVYHGNISKTLSRANDASYIYGMKLQPDLSWRNQTYNNKVVNIDIADEFSFYSHMGAILWAARNNCNRIFTVGVDMDDEYLRTESEWDLEKLTVTPQPPREQSRLNRLFNLTAAARHLWGRYRVTVEPLFDCHANWQNFCNFEKKKMAGRVRVVSVWKKLTFRVTTNRETYEEQVERIPFQSHLEAANKKTEKRKRDDQEDAAAHSANEQDRHAQFSVRYEDGFEMTNTGYYQNNETAVYDVKEYHRSQHFHRSFSVAEIESFVQEFAIAAMGMLYAENQIKYDNSVGRLEHCIIELEDHESDPSWDCTLAHNQYHSLVQRTYDENPGLLAVIGEQGNCVVGKPVFLIENCRRKLSDIVGKENVLFVPQNNMVYHVSS